MRFRILDEGKPKEQVVPIWLNERPDGGVELNIRNGSDMTQTILILHPDGNVEKPVFYPAGLPFGYDKFGGSATL